MRNVSRSNGRCGVDLAWFSDEGTLTYALLRMNISMVNTIMVTYCEHGTQSNARPCLSTAVHARVVAAAAANCSYRQPCTLGGWNPGVVYNIGHRELKRPAEAIQPV